jgi:hypothetical protein
MTSDLKLLASEIRAARKLPMRDILTVARKPEWPRWARWITTDGALMCGVGIAWEFKPVPTTQRWEQGKAGLQTFVVPVVNSGKWYLSLRRIVG